MRIFIITILAGLLVSCQKEVSIDNNQGIASTFDSLVGRWQYKYDYRLVTTVADTTVVIDSLYSGRYDPFSYFEINADSTFKWWRSESRSLPMYGGGEGGYLTAHEPLRQVRWRSEFSTNDDFVTTTPYSTPYRMHFRIKYLDADSMVLTFRVIAQGNPANYWIWHDVYVR
jgi:hypothetical protein